MAPYPREAKLRSEFAAFYPGVPPGIWLPAADLGATLLMQHLRAPAPPELGNRLLDESHFEFRGGASRGAGATDRTRRGENGNGDMPLTQDS